jgi:hypothetical protein
LLFGEMVLKERNKIAVWAEGIFEVGEWNRPQPNPPRRGGSVRFL